MGEAADQVTSFVLNHMKIADMRPREDFERGDQVQVIGRDITGRIEKIDADKRLAWLITANKDGWWYLKDLEKVNLLTTNHTKNAKKVQFTCDPDRFYAKFNRYPCILIPYEDVVDA